MILDFITNQVSAIYLHCSKDRWVFLFETVSCRKTTDNYRIFRITFSSNRLYCESKDSPSRKICQYVCFLILDVLLQAIAPIVPHLTEEAFSYHPAYAGNYFHHLSTYIFYDICWLETETNILGSRSYFRSEHASPSSDWKDEDAVEKIVKVLEIKKQLIAQNGSNLSQLSVTVEASKPVFEMLKVACRTGGYEN